MKKTRLMALTVFLLGLACATGIADLEIKISSSKSTYLLREPILVHYKVINTGKSPVEVERLQLSYMFVVQDEHKKKYRPMTSVETVDLNPQIAAGEIVEETVDILGYGAPINKTSYTPALEKGIYTIYMEIKPPDRGSFVSNTFKFEVVEPSGNEKKAMSLILEADSLLILKQKEASYRKLLEVYKNYPTSVYADYCFSRALSRLYLSGGEGNSELLALSREFIDKYPNSNYLNDALLDILQYYKSKKDRNGYMEELKLLMEKYPDAEVSRKAKNRLENIDKVEF